MPALSVCGMPHTILCTNIMHVAQYSFPFLGHYAYSVTDVSIDSSLFTQPVTQAYKYLHNQPI